MNQKLLFGAIVLVLLIGLVLLALQYWIAGGIITVIGGVLLFFVWRLWMILRISEAMAKQDFELAKRHMAAIKNPEKLNDYSKTYYSFFKGMIETQENNFKGAEASFRKALEINRFRAPDEKATSHLMLAQLQLRKRNRQGARRHLQEAKGLTSNPQILDQIKSLVKQARIRL